MNHVAPGSDFSVLGVSMGGLHAAAVASILHEHVINVNLVVPLGVTDDKNDPFGHVPWASKIAFKLMGTAYFSDLFSYYVLIPDMIEDFNKFLTSPLCAEDWENTDQKETVKSTFWKDFIRSVFRTKLGHQRMIMMFTSEIEKKIIFL